MVRRIFRATFDKILTAGSAVRIVSDLALNLWLTFLTGKKGAQIRLKIAPIAQMTSRVCQIWSQIVFLICLKIDFRAQLCSKAPSHPGTLKYCEETFFPGKLFLCTSRAVPAETRLFLDAEPTMQMMWQMLLPIP